MEHTGFGLMLNKCFNAIIMAGSGLNNLSFTCLVSLFQWVQNRFSALSISLLGT